MEVNHKIKVGDVFFIKSYNLAGYEILCYEFDKLYASGKTHYYTFTKSDILFVIKYIGNGVFEEMVTHEKISSQLGSKGLFKSILEFEFDDYDSNIMSYPIEFETYIKKNKSIGDRIGLIPLFKDCYIEKLERMVDRIIEYPIVLISEISNLYSISDNYLKKEYLANTDSERIKIINKVKKLAIKDSKKAMIDIKKEIERTKNTNILSLTISGISDLNKEIESFQKKKIMK